MVKCPRCGEENSKPVAGWVGGAKTGKPMNVRRFVCSSCGVSYAAWTDSKTGRTRVMARKG